jgi:D-threo-aldose 1-dehydrogenase
MSETRLGFGAAGIGNHLHAVSDAQATALLDAAWEAGIRHFDTAPHYGLGLSERRLGAFLAGKPRAEFTISTKVGRLIEPWPEGADRLDDEDFAVPADHRRVWDFTEAGVRRSLDESLERLGLDHVDVLYLHDPERHDLERGIAEGLPALARLREEGRVGSIGVGSMDTAALLAAVRSGLADQLMVAGRYTLADQSAAAAVLPACVTYGVTVVAAAVFNGGLLATAPGPDSTFDYRAAPPEVVAHARALDELCRAHGVPLRAAALQFPLRHPVVTTVVAGGAEPEHVRQNVELLATPIPDALWADLAERELVVA